MYDLSALEQGPLALITNPISAMWRTFVDKAVNIGAYMGLILGLGHLLFLAVYIYRRGLKVMCLPFNTVWKRMTKTVPANKAPGPAECPGSPADDEVLVSPGAFMKDRRDPWTWAGQNLLQDAKVMYHLTRPTEPPPPAPSGLRELKVLRPVGTAPAPPAYSAARHGTPGKRNTLYHSQARYGLLSGLQD